MIVSPILQDFPPYRRGRVKYCTWDKLAWRYEGEYNGYIEFTIPDYNVKVWDEDKRPKATGPLLWADFSNGPSEIPSLIEPPTCATTDPNYYIEVTKLLKNFLKSYNVKFRGTYTLQSVVDCYFKNPPKFDIPKLTTKNITNLTNPDNWTSYDNVKRVNGSIKMSKTKKDGKLILGWYLYGSCHNCSRILEYKTKDFLNAFKFEYKGPAME